MCRASKPGQAGPPGLAQAPDTPPLMTGWTAQGPPPTPRPRSGCPQGRLPRRASGLKVPPQAAAGQSSPPGRRQPLVHGPLRMPLIVLNRYEY